MTSNPYSPPQSPLADPPASPAPPGSPVKAVIAGLAIDLGGSTAVSLVLGLVYVVSLARSGMSPAEIEAAAGHIPLGSWVSIAGIGAGTVLSALAGFVCSRMARSRSYGPGLVLAGLSTAVGLWVSHGRHPWLATLLLLALSFAAVWAGVLGLRKAMNFHPEMAARGIAHTMPPLAPMPIEEASRS